MPTLQEILAAKRLAKQKEQQQVQATNGNEAGTDTKPVSTLSEVVSPMQSQSQSQPQSVPQFATNLANELRSMAQEQDWEDVEQSANSLAEILAVILDLPYPPDVFISDCIDHAATALENQKNQYLRDVLNGKKQSGKRQKASADLSPLQQSIELDKLTDDDIFVYDPLADVGG